MITLEEYERRLEEYFKARQTGPCDECGEHCDDTRRAGLCPDCWLMLVLGMPSQNGQW